MSQDADNRSELTALSGGAFLVALAVHIGAGLLDEGRIVLQPVGHLTLLAFMVWLVAIITATVAIIGVSRWRMKMLAGAILGLSILGLVVLVTG
ncbi:MAG: hypothetical protein ACJ74W_08550 [Pyrinomonadaceae bacterium]